jgi:hypothetical protein
LGYQALTAGRASIWRNPQVDPFIVFNYELVKRDIGIADSPESVDQFQTLGDQVKGTSVLVLAGGDSPHGLV